MRWVPLLNTMYVLFSHGMALFLWNSLRSEVPAIFKPFGVIKVSMLTHTYPHKLPRKIKVTICSHQTDSQPYLWPDVWSGDLQEKVWSYMTLNVLTETRCHKTTNHPIFPDTSKRWVLRQNCIQSTGPRGIRTLFTMSSVYVDNVLAVYIISHVSPESGVHIWPYIYVPKVHHTSYRI